MKAKAAKTRRLPPLPKRIDGILGRITVVRAPYLTDGSGEDAKGLWESNQRVISVLEPLAEEVEWWTLYHEYAHSILDDLCVDLPRKKEEDVCNAFAAALALHIGGHRVKLP